MEAVGALLAAFAQRARDDVAQAVGGLAAQLAAGAGAVETRFDALSDAMRSADGALRAEAAAADAALVAAGEQRRADEGALAASLEEASQQGTAS